MSAPEPSRTRRMMIVTGANGAIVAAAQLQSDAAEPRSRLEPLPGQQAYEVDVPEEVAEIAAGHSFLMTLTGARIEPGEGKLVLAHPVRRIVVP